jgi:hypothetical protein
LIGALILEYQENKTLPPSLSPYRESLDIRAFNPLRMQLETPQL